MQIFDPLGSTFLKKPRILVWHVDTGAAIAMFNYCGQIRPFPDQMRTALRHIRKYWEICIMIQLKRFS
ncbi:hypothetical protein ADH68_11595 [Muribaculum intestinale]|nr:hypothetical protein ADH68_11595 [Muribaculum intestinale]